MSRQQAAARRSRARMQARRSGANVAVPRERIGACGRDRPKMEGPAAAGGVAGRRAVALRRAAAPRRAWTRGRRNGSILRRGASSPGRDAGRRCMGIVAPARAGGGRAGQRLAAGRTRVGFRFAVRLTRTAFRRVTRDAGVRLRLAARRARAGLWRVAGLAPRGDRFRLRIRRETPDDQQLADVLHGCRTELGADPRAQQLALGAVVAEHADLDQLVRQQRDVDFMQDCRGQPVLADGDDRVQRVCLGP